MQAIDPRYIAFFGVLLVIFVLIVLLLVGRIFADTIPGLMTWSWGCLSIAAASVLFIVRPPTAPAYLIVVANVLFTGGFIILYAGLRQFIALRTNYLLLACAWFAITCLLGGLVYGGRYIPGTILISLFNGTVFLACGFLILKRMKTGLVEVLTGSAYLLTSLVSYSRALTAIAGIHVPSDLYDPSLMQKLYIASFPLLFLSVCLGFILMVYNKARAIVVGLNVDLEAKVATRTVELRDEIKRREALEREVARLIDRERRRIGQELHDNLGQRMTGLSLLAESLAIKLKALSPQLSDQANAIERTAAEAVLETRRLAHGVLPVIPGAKGLRAALAELARDVSVSGKLQCTLSANAELEVNDEFVATHLFRIAQEGVSNVVRHGHATVATIRLERANNKTTLSITDNGTGFANLEDDKRGGQGLRIMAYRASLIHYDLKIDGAPGSGTTIRVREQ